MSDENKTTLQTLSARTIALKHCVDAGLVLDVEMTRMIARAEDGLGATPEEVLALATAWAVWVRDGEQEALAQSDVRRRLSMQSEAVLSLVGRG